MDRRAWEAAFHAVAKMLDMTWRLNNNRECTGLPRWLSGKKNLPAMQEIPGSGGSSGEGNADPL